MNRNGLGLLLLALSIILIIAFVGPQIRQVRGSTIEKYAHAKVLDKKKQRLAALQQLNSVFTTQEDRINRLITTLPQQPEIPEILVSFEAMAKESGIQLAGINPQVDARQQKVTATLTGKGDLGAIEKLAQAIADNNRPLSVLSVSLSRIQETNQLNFVMNVAIPYANTDKAQTYQR